MRRKDREVTDAARINQIISSCSCIRLGFVDNGQVYIVPLSFGFTVQDGVYVFYFHSAKEGRKMALIRQSPTVGFEMDANVSIQPADSACGHSARFQSVIGSGHVQIVQDPDEKRQGLLSIMQQNTGAATWHFPAPALDAVCVFKMTVDQLSCKAHE